MFDNKILRALALMLASVLLLAAAACAPGNETASSEAASKSETSSQSEAASKAETASQGGASETASQAEAPSSQAAASSQESSGADLIKGALANGVYTNAWAGFKFTLPAGLTAVDEEQLAMYGNETVVFGLMAMNNSDATRMITVMFEDASANEATAEEYLAGMAEQTADAGGSAGYTITASDLFKFTVAGKEYATVRFEISGGTDDGASLGIRLNGGKLVQYYCLRKQDDVFVSIMVADASEDWIKSTLASFTAA